MEGMKSYVASDRRFVYSGRIDDSIPNEPELIWAASSVSFKTDSSHIIIRCYNKRFNDGWDNSLSILVDGEHAGKICIPRDLWSEELDISRYCDGKMHEYTIFKRHAGCHYFVFKGIVLDDAAQFIAGTPSPKLKLEVFGDSISCGEVSEAVLYAGKQDPDHQGEMNNAYYSYAYKLARKLGAELHDTSQGGIALLDGDGYFVPSHYVGMVSTYDKLKYNPDLEPVTAWDFSRWVPDIVIIALGQNDQHFINYMHDDYDGERASYWRAEYANFIRTLESHYPDAQFICMTTLLMHDIEWDDAIDEAVKTLDDPHVHHFMFKRNGAGTPGHVRATEADEMAGELEEFIKNGYKREE